MNHSKILSKVESAYYMGIFSATIEIYMGMLWDDKEGRSF